MERRPLRGAAGPGGWMVGGGQYAANVRDFVSLSTQPLNFPAARSPEAGRFMLANWCGLG